MEVYLEGSRQRADIPSCKVGEFAEVYRYAVRFLEAGLNARADESTELAKEILERWAPSLSVEDLTEDDIWTILMAKAGRRREILEKLPKLAAEAMVDFFHAEGMEGVKALTEQQTSSSHGEKK